MFTVPIMAGATVPQRFGAVAAQFPERPAVGGRNPLTYRALAGLAARYASIIHERTGAPTGPVVVCAPPGPETLALLLGILHSGRAYLYADPDDPPARCQVLVVQSEARLLIADDPTRLMPTVPSLRLAELHVPRETGAAQAASPADPAAPCCLVQTSGSTSAARGVSISHRTLLHNIDNFRTALGITTADRLSLLASPRFAAANSAIFGALLSGACVCPFDVRGHGLGPLVTWLRDAAITILHITPSLFRLLARQVVPGSLPLLRAVKLGGEPAFRSDVALFRAAFGPDCLLVNGLGLSEAGGNICHYAVPSADDAPEGEMLPVGKPLPGHSVAVVDAEGLPLPAGAIGEIVVRSAHLAYAGWTPTTADQADRVKELRTGDLGKVGADGNLTHLGRKDRVIKLRGFRVDLNAVEAALLQLPMVRNAFAELEASVQPSLHAHVEVDDDADVGAMRQELARRLPDYMVPQRLVCHARMPLTANGKIDRRKLADQGASPPPRILPRTGLEERIAAVWSAILGCPTLGVYDNFFELGGDSLRGMDLILRMSQELEQVLPLALLLNHPSVAQMAEALTAGFVEFRQPARARRPRATLLALRPFGHRPPLIFLPGGYGSENELLTCAGLVPYLDAAHPVFGIRLNLLDKEVVPPRSVASLARQVVRQLRKTLGGRTPILVGECLASGLALETARMLARKTGTPPLLVLLEPPAGTTAAGQASAHPPAVERYFQLLRSHQPRPYAGEVHVVVCQDRAQAAPRSVWEAGGHIHRHVVPGTHHTYIRQERRSLAQALTEICASSSARLGSPAAHHRRHAGRKDRVMSVLGRAADRLLSMPGKNWFAETTMARYGIRTLMRSAKVYNGWRYRSRVRRHRSAYEHEFEALLREHDAQAAVSPRILMQDGWAIDTSGTLPGLDRLLYEAGEVVRARGGKQHSDVQQPYFRNLFFLDDLQRYPSFLEFPLSADVLATVAYYLQTIPVLSKTRPPGIRFMESNQNLDPQPPGPFGESQLYHLDLHDTPLVYVIVLIEDVTPESGPWTFLPASASRRARKQLGYQQRGAAYRVTDEEMYQVVDRREAIEFSYPKGTVLFIDSSKCFHFGSRLSYRPRFQMMYAFTSAARCDFSQAFMRPFPYPIGPVDSRLRRMVLE